MSEHYPDRHQPHVSVLLAETMTALSLNANSIAVDCTVGAGGHTAALLEAVGAGGRVFGLDRDPEALRLAGRRLEGAIQAGRLVLINARFGDLGTVLREQGVFGVVDGICADLGVSSMHLDQPLRGFSLQADGPLDMRMNQSSAGGDTAADLLASADEATLIGIFRDYGEEPQARQIARRIVQERQSVPITSTLQLAELVKKAVSYSKPSRKHPATRVFQALRIAVNDELGELRSLLDEGFQALKPGGRFAVISFHSLEDRLIKLNFIDKTGRRARQAVDRSLPLSAAELAKISPAQAELGKPFPIIPSAEETAQNPRSRSAKLRVLTKIPTPATP